MLCTLFCSLIEYSVSCCGRATEKPGSWEGWILSEHWSGGDSCAADVGGKTSRQTQSPGGASPCLITGCNPLVNIQC